AAAPSETPRAWRRELAEGWRALIAHRVLVLLACAAAAFNFAWMMITTTLVLHVQENLGLGAPGYGLVMVGAACGGVAGGFLAGRIAAWLGRGATMQAAMAVCSVGIVGMALAPGPVLLTAVLAGFEFMGVPWNAVSISMRQRLVDGPLLGRVQAIYRLAALAVKPLGILLAGVLMRVADGPLPRGEALLVPFWVAAAVLGLATLAFWRPLGRAVDAA
ncbi:MAG: MFS transporter, partial [Shimia sp.]